MCLIICYRATYVKIDTCYVLQKGETLKTRQQLANRVIQIKEAADADAAKKQQKELLLIRLEALIILLPLQMSLRFAGQSLRLSFFVLFSTGGNRWAALGRYVTAAVTDFLDAQGCS